MSNKVHPEQQMRLGHIYNGLFLKQNRPDIAYNEALKQLRIVRYRQEHGKQPSYAKERVPSNLTPEQDLAYRLEMADLAVVTGKSHMMRQKNLAQAIPHMIGVTRLIDEEYPIAQNEQEAIARGQVWESAYDDEINAHFKTLRELYNFLSIMTQVFPGRELQKVQHAIYQLLFLEQSFSHNGEPIDNAKQSHDMLIARMEHFPVNEVGQDLEHFLDRWSGDANEVIAVTSSFSARALSSGNWRLALQALKATGGKILETVPESLQLAPLAVRNFAKNRFREQRIKNWAHQYKMAPEMYDFSEIEQLAKSWQHFGVGNHTAVTLQK